MNTETYKRDYMDRPCVVHSYKKRPSWRAYGDGRARIQLSLRHDGGLDIKASEFPDTLRGGKEVYVELPPEQARALADMINEARSATKGEAV